ncbi:hypothetical protein SNEBB_011490 [Seison nebaliae]|nr:hypothetical protein SNEBB_011490 [Seison nebaliae]
MSFWADHYMPKIFDECQLHKKINENLKNICVDGVCPNILLYGPNGGGKKMRVQCMLNELFPEENLKNIRSRQIDYTVNSKSHSFNVLLSNVHVEVNPSEYSYQDRQVITQLIQNFVKCGNKTKPIVFVIHSAHKLSPAAQHTLRQTLEMYSSQCRFILVVEMLSRIIPAIQSRFLMIRIPYGKMTEITGIMQTILRREKLDDIYSLDDLKSIVEEHNFNLRYCLLQLEMNCRRNVNGPKDANDVNELKTQINQIAQLILREQRTPLLQEIRNKYYHFLAHCIPAHQILQLLVRALFQQLPKYNYQKGIRKDIIMSACLFDERMKQEKPLFHLEAFTANVMWKLNEKKKNN